MKTPRFYNYLLAQSFEICLHIGGYVGIVLLCGFLPFKISSFFENISMLAIFVVISTTSYLLGMKLGVFVLWPVLHPIAKKINGSPFRIGDVVIILAGEYGGSKAEVIKIYSGMMSHTVRLLGRGENSVSHELFIADYKIFKIKSARCPPSLSPF